MTDTNSPEQPYPRPLSGAQVECPPPSLVPTRTILQGRFVTLEPQNAAAHAADLYRASHSSTEALRIWDFLAYGPWPDLESYESALRTQSASHDTVFYTIRSNTTNACCGQASFLDINAQNGVIEIGHIWFAPELQKTPGGTEALFLMLCHAMDDLGYRRMQWRCNSLNEKSRAAARRLGFRYEGTFHNHMIFKGKNRDTAWYSILDDEWSEVRDRISSWLAPANFTDEATPLSSLGQSMSNRSQSVRS